ncbi:MAG: SpoIIE family protein phosphatase, partial [Caldilineaceae bacterium]|nr:SpoIIE family protein phosphatase [Caldilineaceae bacterium]
VGGDFYDVAPLDDAHVGIVLADVADKGFHAALFMAVSRTLFLQEGKHSLSPSAVALAVHRGMMEVSATDDMFVTAFYGVLHRPSGRLTYVRAAQERPLLFRPGVGVQALPADGRFLAVSLSPYSLANPTPAQAFHEQIFHGMLATLQIWPPGQPTPPPPLGLSWGSSRSPIISADGRFVAFLSAGPLTANAPGGVANVFIRDTNLGQTELISRDVDGRALTIPVYGMTMSANAQVVAYYSFAGNIVLGDELDCGSAEQPISCEDLFIVDRLAGTTERVPLGRPQGLGADHTLALSADGRFVAYGHAGNLWLYDRGTQTAEPLLAGVNGGGANDAIFAPRFAADGRTLAFVTRASNLLVNDANATYDVFVLELDSGQIQRVSVATDGTEADNRSGVHSFVETFDGAVDISANGRFVAFSSAAANLSAEATAACPDYRGPDRPCLNLYLHDRVTGETRLITRQSNGDSY